MVRKHSVRGGVPLDNGTADFPFGTNAQTTTDRPDPPRPLTDGGHADTTAPASADPSANLFSRQALRHDQYYAAALGLQKHIHHIPADKPPG
jgi:hypothetical protein